MHISINGELLSLEEAGVLTSEGYNFGYGLFETIKVKDFKLVFWREHMDRLSRGLRKIGLDDDIDRELMFLSSNELIELNGLENGALKIIVSKNRDSKDVVLTTRTADYPEELYSRGFNLNISSCRRNPHSIIPYVKSLNYMENVIEREKSLQAGCDDCLFLNTENHVAETSISNLFFIKDRTVFTPRLECGLLDGIVRSKVVEIVGELGYTVEEGDYIITELLNADESFLTNSLMGVMPIGSLGEKLYETSNFKITGEIRKRYGERANAEIDA